MKKLLHFYRPLTLAFFVFALLPSIPSMAQREYDEEVTLQTFYDELEPYGQWVDDPEYGYVWVPDVEDPDFRPYSTNGRWVMTEYGNTWVSDYEWGWAPFHYGRWAFTDYYGWIWIPDTEWGPAWVTWRSNDEYYGWAPLGPNVSVDMAIGSDYYCPDPWWTFVPRPYFYHDHWYDYYVPYYRNRGYISATIIIGNTYSYNNRRYLCGPDIYDIRRGGINVNIFSITNINRPGRTVIRNNYVNIYRPRINNRGDFRPGRMVSRDNFHRRDYARGGNFNRGRGEMRTYQGNRNNQPGRDFRNRPSGSREPIAERRGNSYGRPPMTRGNNQGPRESGRYNNRQFERRENAPGNGGRGRQYRAPENRSANPGNRGGNGGFENRRFNNNNGGNQRPPREYRSQSQPRGNSGGNRMSPGGGGNQNREINRGGNSRGNNPGSNSGSNNRGGERGRRGG